MILLLCCLKILFSLIIHLILLILRLSLLGLPISQELILKLLKDLLLEVRNCNIDLTIIQLLDLLLRLILRPIDLRLSFLDLSPQFLRRVYHRLALFISMIDTSLRSWEAASKRALPTGFMQVETAWLFIDRVDSFDWLGCRVLEIACSVLNMSVGEIPFLFSLDEAVVSCHVAEVGFLSCEGLLGLQGGERADETLAGT